MSFSSRAGLRRPVTLTIATAAMTTLAMAPTAYAQAQPVGATSATTATYLVQLDGAPLAAYTGGVSGIPGTRPAPGAKLDRNAWNFKAYRDYLRNTRTDVLRRAGVDKKAVADYDTVVNGVAAKLTPAEVAKLHRTPGVVNVWKNEVVNLDTVSTPRFLGLDGPNGVWQRQFGGPQHAGEGTIVGVIDTGIWPDNPSFAPLPEPRPDQAIIDAKWSGECVPGKEEPVKCNNKLIGARHYNFGEVEIIPEEFESPRDFDGHGTHTASTAAGNHDAPAVINGVEEGRASGMAPVARVAAYKICWEVPDFTTASCGALEAVAAIDDATADGVDVINYSISGATSTITGLVHVAFLNAAAAGVFVATSAGNTPGASTVAHNAPWVTTVAASTHDRAYTKSVTLGNGTTYTGVGVGPAVPSSPLIDSVNAGLPGANPTQVELCFVGTLDPAKVTGKIVLCARGVNPRIDKSLAVKQAGGVGMILYNPSPNSLNADFHLVPTVHVDTPTGQAIKAYIAGTASPTASLSAAVQVTARAPAMAAFSSQGPALAGNGDLLKPDVTAPGVDVIAAVSPAKHHGNLYDALSGTSMSSPHVAGVAALLRSRFPNWSPMAIKSAIMTTAVQTDNTGAPIQRAGANATPLDYGAGHIRPPAAFDPGLVYESGPLQWLQYACGIGEHLEFSDGSDVCDTTGSIDPSNLNYPSIAVGDLAGKQTITRTVTNVTNRASIYFARVTAPAGFTVRVNPSALLVLPRRSATFTVEIIRTTAAYGTWSFGSLTWSDLRGHSVRSPIAVRAVPVGAPVEVTGTGTSGSVALQVRAGFTGTLTAAPYGLVASTVTVRHLVGVETGFDPSNPAENPAVAKATVTVPAGSKLARFGTFNSDHPPGTDLDVFVYKAGTKELVGLSADGDSEELVTLTAAGSYDVYVVQYGLPSGVGEQDVKLHSFVVPSTPAGNLTVTPASQPVQLGQLVTVTATWSGLAAGAHYLGLVEYGEGSTPRGQTIIAVNT